MRRKRKEKGKFENYKIRLLAEYGIYLIGIIFIICDQSGEVKKEELKLVSAQYNPLRECGEKRKEQYSALKSKYDNLTGDGSFAGSLLKEIDAKLLGEDTVFEEKVAEHQKEEQNSSVLEQQSRTRNNGLETVYWEEGKPVYHTLSDCLLLYGKEQVESGSMEKSGRSQACRVCCPQAEEKGEEGG